MSEKDDRCAVCNMPRSDHKVFSHHCPKGHWDFAETTFVEPVASPQATRPDVTNGYTFTVNFREAAEIIIRNIRGGAVTTTWVAHYLQVVAESYAREVNRER